jgi:multiple sugar transport system permease protein
MNMRGSAGRIRGARARHLGDIFSNSVLFGPYALLFFFFIAAPIAVAVILSFTYFNMVNAPEWSGLANYIKAFTQDDVLMRNVLPNMIVFSVVVGAVGFVLQFFLAWSLAQVSRWPRTVLALIFYSPSMTAGVTLSVVWKVVFAGDEFGYFNHLLMSLDIIDTPIQWLQSPQYILMIMIIASLWSSMGVGFLSMLAGVLNADAEIYEAGYIDGIRNRFQEVMYITIPSMKPQMLFGSVMAIVNAFSAGQIGIDLTGANPTPQYAGQTMVSHIMDQGFLQYNMGYATALSVILLLLVFLVSQFANKFFADRD